MDTNKMREQFEDWASGQFVMPVEVIKACRYEHTYAYTVLNIAWRGWEAYHEVVVPEVERLSRWPIQQVVGGIADAVASHLAQEAKGCLEKGLVEQIEQLRTELGALVAAVSDLGGKHDEPGWRNLWRARDKARSALDAAMAKEASHD